MEKGRGEWLKVYRKAFSDHDLLWGESRERTRWEAWMDLIQMAAWKDHDTLYKGATVRVKRGQVPTSQRTLADRWRWSRAKVRRFLDLLEDHHRISTETDRGVPHGLTLVTITNYTLYQDRPADRPTDRPAERPATTRDSGNDRPADRPADEPSDGPVTAQTEEGKEGKEGKREASGVPRDTDPSDEDGKSLDPYGGKLPSAANLIRDGRHYVYPPAFEEAWSLYPDRYGSNPKKGAYAAWRARATNGVKPESLLTATRHYAEFAEKTEKAGTEFVQQAATFYGPKEPWREYIEPPKSKNNGPRYDRL